MLTEPAIGHDLIHQALRRLYHLDVHALRFLSPGGECSWSYKVEAAQGSYFLKLSQTRVCGDQISERGLVAADSLAEALGQHQIITALRAPATRQFLNSIEGYTAVVIPFVDGQSQHEGGLTAEQRFQLGELVAHIHQYVPDMTLLPPHDTLGRNGVQGWQRLSIALDQPSPEWTPIQQQMADLLRAVRGETERLIAEYAALEQVIRADRRIPLMFCHGDPSAGNVLVRPDGTIALIDWDSPVWGPPEHDLFHLKDDAEVMAGYRRVAGVVYLNETLLKAFQYAWDIGEIVDYGFRTLLTTQSEAQYAHDVQELGTHLRDTGLII